MTEHERGRNDGPPADPAPPGQLDRLFVEGPGQARFELNDVPASTRVEDVARAVMNEYDPELWGKDHHGQPRRAVVDHVKPDGSQQRLDPEATLAEAGISPGAALRVRPARDTDCLKRLYLGGGPLRADALRAGLPPLLVPPSLPLTSAIDLILAEIERRGALPELLVLAALHWPEDAELQSLLRQLAAGAAEPRHVAPRAWAGMRAGDQRALQALWHKVQIYPV